MKSFTIAAFVATAAAVPAWNDWTSTDPVAVYTSSKPAEETSSTSTWADWSATSSDPVKITSTSTYEESSTWADWSATSSSTPAEVTSSSYDPTWSDWESASATSTSVEYTTTVVTALETYCPYATKFTHAGVTYDVTSATTITITDCPCTIQVPVETKTTTSCDSSSTPAAETYKSTPAAETWAASSGYPVAAGSGSAGWPVSPYATTSAPIAAYTGAANRVANVGAGLAGVAAAAVLLL